MHPTAMNQVGTYASHSEVSSPPSVTHGCHGLGVLDKAVRISHVASELGTSSEAFQCRSLVLIAALDDSRLASQKQNLE